ncbi:hypothetical protein H2508_00130 [Parahaliea sp. F7430]|uniref:PhoP regulatory network protein YrbL n=1 Tax=Sediminihaliea albiluteola TaxID=2758564 RepID=A0A7W2TTA6_9GAMM|nr:YrbL family protein [Sediminihaliea albiluteola]MBA6411526.1 hypothetical protein [Sediminihaliea albiluteola]
MLSLDNAIVLGKGLHRICFQHPNDAALCVKIVYNGNLQESEREQTYYQILQRRLKDWSLIPRFHGTRLTSKGMGAIFDRIHDSDGSTSKTLQHYLDDNNLSHGEQDEILQSLERLYRYQLDNAVVSMNLKPANIAYQKTSTGNHCVIIDNLGNSDWIPLATHCAPFARLKIKRKWQRFERFFSHTPLQRLHFL